MKQNYLFIKLFMLTVMAFFAGNVMADEAVFDFTTSDGLKAMGIPESSIPTAEASVETGVAFETTGPFTINGVTITATNAGDGQNTCRVWSPKGNNGTKYDYRVYGNKDKENNGSLTITAPSGKNLSKIVFATGSTWNVPTASEGDLNGKEWNGNANSLTLTMNAGQCQFKTITVTFADAGTIVTKKSADLSFSAEQVELILGETSFTAPTLTKATTAEVKYSSTNTSIATVDENTGVVTITAEAAGTAKIRATTEENDEYYAGQAEYQIIVKEAANGVANIAALNALDNGTEFVFNGKATVVYAYDNSKKGYVYIKDDTGSSLIYKTGTGLEKGDVIKAGWEGKVSVYNNLFEVIPSTTLEKDGTAEVTYPVATAADVKAENMNQVVVLKGVTYGEINKSNFKINSDIAGYNQFNITIPEPEDGATYDIEGVIGVFKQDVQFQPISLTRVPEVVDITVAPESGDIAEAVDAEAKKVTDEGNVVGNITINLTEKGSYTISKSLTSQGNVVINGAEGVTIDASALSAPFITSSGATTKVLKADGTESDYAEVAEITIKDVKIIGLSNSLISNSSKTLFDKITVENSIIEIIGSKVIFALGNGYPTDLQITMSTMWSKEGHTGFLFQAQGRPKDIGADATATFTIANSTMYQIGVGKKINNNNSGLKGQKCLFLNLTNNILCDFGSSAGNEVNGWLFGQNSTNPTAVYENNTYWSAATGGEAVAGWTDASKQGSDQSGTSLTTDPSFKDAANGDFTLASTSDQNVKKTGDPRWLVEEDPTGIVNVENSLTDNANAPAYNLAGQRVSKQVKGIIIKNGRKYVK